MNISERLRALRGRAAISARELDQLAGLGAGHVSMIETGRRDNPTVDTSKAIARTLGCSVGWLVAGEGEPPADETLLASVATARERQASERSGPTVDRSPEFVQPDAESAS